MSRYVFKMPDLGEGTVEAEIVEWKVKVGDVVREDQVIAEVMTDKAAVEVPAPVSGTVLAVTGQPGEMVAVGAELIVFDTAGEAAPAGAVPAAAAAVSRLRLQVPRQPHQPRRLPQPQPRPSRRPRPAA
jgi:2-oxoisovalerate dehydrogenase E2 component (dihydrolipoyl transacylase)